MTATVRAILDTIETLSQDERHELVAELLRISPPEETAEVADDAFVSAAEGLFLELDRREAADANPHA